MGKISIVVPIYNVEKYLPRCIESIIGQTYENLEIILVNDGSTDNSGKICEYYANIDSRITVIHKKNGGLSDARNKGIDIATGELIGFVDSDDYITKDMYEFLFGLIKKYDADISICGKFITNPEGDILNVKKESFEWELDSEQAIKEMLKEENFNTTAWDKLYKVNLFKDIRYPYGKVSEDLFTTYKLLDKANSIAVSSQPKYYYVQTPNSIMRSNFSVKKLDTLRALEEIVPFLETKYPKLVKYSLNMYVRYNIAYIRQIIESSFDNEIIIEEMLESIKKNLFGYLFSHYRVSSKFFAVALSISYPISKQSYITMLKVIARHR